MDVWAHLSDEVVCLQDLAPAAKQSVLSLDTRLDHLGTFLESVLLVGKEFHQMVYLEVLDQGIHRVLLRDMAGYENLVELVNLLVFLFHLLLLFMCV